MSTVYGHMYPDGVLVRQGESIKEGQHIADIGSNGQTHRPAPAFRVVEGWPFKPGPGGRPVVRVGQAEDQRGSVCVPNRSPRRRNCKTGAPPPPPVPREFAPWLLKAGALCPGITPPLLAAQLEAENGFRDCANAPVSSTGARGPAPFMPGTWATWGKDADASGPPPDINSIPDAVMAQGALMCENYKLCMDGISKGTIAGDPVALSVAAYNAGFGAVQRNGGMPSGGDYTVQTQPYVYKIMQRARAFEASPAFAGTPQTQAPTVQARGRQAVVDAALKFKGTKWVWGGGSADGPTRDGFDSAGLTFFAVSRGTDGKLVLPRTADEQWSFGNEIPLDQVQPGTWCSVAGLARRRNFGETLGDRQVRPSHVGIAVGKGQIIHAGPESRGRDRRLQSGISRSAGDMKRRIAPRVSAVMLGLIPAVFGRTHFRRGGGPTSTAATQTRSSRMPCRPCSIGSRQSMLPPTPPTSGRQSTCRAIWRNRPITHPSPGSGSQWEQWRAGGATIAAQAYFVADETPPNSDDQMHRVVVIVQSALNADGRLIDEIRHTAWVTAEQIERRLAGDHIEF